MYYIFLASFSRGVSPSSPLGILILVFGTIFTIGIPLLMIVAGRKDK